MIRSIFTKKAEEVRMMTSGKWPSAAGLEGSEEKKPPPPIPPPIWSRSSKVTFKTRLHFYSWCCSYSNARFCAPTCVVSRQADARLYYPLLYKPYLPCYQWLVNEATGAGWKRDRWGFSSLAEVWGRDHREEEESEGGRSEGVGRLWAQGHEGRSVGVGAAHGEHCKWYLGITDREVEKIS